MQQHLHLAPCNRFPGYLARIGLGCCAFLSNLAFGIALWPKLGLVASATRLQSTNKVRSIVLPTRPVNCEMDIAS